MYRVHFSFLYNREIFYVNKYTVRILTLIRLFKVGSRFLFLDGRLQFLSGMFRIWRVGSWVLGAGWFGIRFVFGGSDSNTLSELFIPNPFFSQGSDTDFDHQNPSRILFLGSDPDLDSQDRFRILYFLLIEGQGLFLDPYFSWGSDPDLDGESWWICGPAATHTAAGLENAKRRTELWQMAIYSSQQSYIILSEAKVSAYFLN